MTSPVDIRPDQLEIVQEILLKHLPARKGLGLREPRQLDHQGLQTWTWP